MTMDIGDKDGGGDKKAPVILVVDDQPVNIAVLRGMLQTSYRVREAESGEAALRAAMQEPLPDLVLLDIQMPQMDGFEVLQQLRKNPLTQDIPVIFVTSSDRQEDELLGFELGAVDYIQKPVNGIIAISRIRTQLQAKVARDMLRKHNQRLEQRVEEDVKELEQAELQLIQSEKMAAMGQLVTGVAHEINNPVGFVDSNLGTLEKYLVNIFALLNGYEQARAGGEAASAALDQLCKDVDVEFLHKDIAALLHESRDGIARVRKIVLDMKDFARTGDVAWQWSDLHRGIDSTLNIVWNELKYKCAVTKRYGDLPQIKCLPSQLNQVFMNLLVNAAQAIETRGEIIITTERVGDDAVRISFCDTGAGIPPDILAHIFDPFFTTKPVGKGTGLGLSISRGIIERHRGKIEVSSEVGKGTTFVITLPLAPDEQTAGQVAGVP